MAAAQQLVSLKPGEGLDLPTHLAADITYVDGWVQRVDLYTQDGLVAQLSIEYGSIKVSVPEPPPDVVDAEVVDEQAPGASIPETPASG